MKSFALVSILVAFSVAAFGARHRTSPGVVGLAQGDAIASAPCPNPLPHEPLVVYEVTGGTLAGPVDGLLTVYVDGFARFGSSLGPGPGFLFSVQVSPQTADQLHSGLLAAGALRQCDQPDFYNDVPLSTLTVLRGDAKQNGNTFSWFVAEGEVGTIEALLQSFIAATFPLPPTGGGGF